MDSVEGRHESDRSASRETRVCRASYPGNSALPSATYHPSGRYRMGPDAIPVRELRGGIAGKTPVRPVLHQEYVARTRFLDPLPLHQNRAFGAWREVIEQMPVRMNEIHMIY